MLIDSNIIRTKNFEKKLTKKKISLFILWMISHKPMHGYDIIKTMKDDPVVISMPASKIYPLLTELNRKRLISHKLVAHGKRMRKVYYITPKGKDVLRKLRAFIKKSPLIMQFAKEMLI